MEQTGMVGRLDDVGRGLASSPRLPHLRSGLTGARGSLADQGRAGWSGRAPLEYWFFRTSWADGALLVDVISRRHEGTVELRVSSQNQGTAQINRLVREHRAGPASDPAQVVGCELTLGPAAVRTALSRGTSISLSTTPRCPPHRLHGGSGEPSIWPSRVGRSQPPPAA